jgi:hypothetical protein
MIYKIDLIGYILFIAGDRGVAFMVVAGIAVIAILWAVVKYYRDPETTENTDTTEKNHTEKNNRGTRVENMSQSRAYWMAERLQNPRKDPFVYYIFSNERDAKAAMLELPFIHTAQDTGKIICDDVFQFGYYAVTYDGVFTGQHDAFVAGADFTHEMWEQTHAAFTKHNGMKKNDLEPDKSVRLNVSANGDARQVTFFDKKREGSNVWMMYKAPSKADAMAFLSQQHIDKPLYYVVVQTPEGTFGKDKDGYYQP